MESIIYALVLGLTVGLIYGLIASGLNIIFGVMRVVNFAHGGFMILASYMAFWLWTLYGIRPLTALLVIIPVFFVLGVLTYYLTVPRLLNAEDTEMMSLILFFGLYIVIEAGMDHFWGSQTRGITAPYEGILPRSISLLGVSIPTSRLLGGAVALVVTIILFWFLFQTYHGKAMRAMIQNREAVQFLGINTHKISAMAFGIGLVLAGIAGVLLTVIYPSFDPVAGEIYTLIAFAIIVMGGLGDPVGAVIAGIVFATVEQLATIWLPLAASPILAFIVLVGVILLRPNGLFRIQDIRKIVAKLQRQ